jgi:hypothetical protein
LLHLLEDGLVERLVFSGRGPGGFAWHGAACLELPAGNEAYRYYFANDPDFESLRSSERFQTVVGPG